MTKKEQLQLKKYLNDAVDNYFEWINRDDFPDKACVRKAGYIAQTRVFNLADMLFHNQIISFEEWCECTTKVGITEDDWIDCQYKCDANIDGKCKYALERLEEQKSLAEYKKHRTVVI